MHRQGAGHQAVSQRKGQDGEAALVELRLQVVWGFEPTESLLGGNFESAHGRDDDFGPAVVDRVGGLCTKPWIIEEPPE